MRKISIRVSGIWTPATSCAESVCVGVMVFFETCESSCLAWEHMAEKREHGKSAGQRLGPFLNWICQRAIQSCSCYVRTAACHFPAFNVGNWDRRVGRWKHPSMPGKRSGKFVFRATQESVNLSISSSSDLQQKRRSVGWKGSSFCFYTVSRLGSLP